MKHAILTRNNEHFKMMETHLRRCHTELRAGGATQIRLPAQLMGIRNIILHIVEGWEYGFRQTVWRDISRAIKLLESTGRVTIMTYKEDGSHSRPFTDVRGQLDQYRSHKVVRAGQIQEVHRVEERGQFFLRIITTKGIVIEENSRTWLDRLPSQILGGYYVLYEDGYTSWSPAKAFEAGNSLLEPEARFPWAPSLEPEPQGPFQASVNPHAPPSVANDTLYVQVGVNIMSGATIPTLRPSPEGTIAYTVRVGSVRLEDTTLFITVDDGLGGCGIVYKVKRLGRDEYQKLGSIE